MTSTLATNRGQTTEVMLGAAINLALAEAMEEDPKVVVLGEDIADPVGGVLKVTTGLSTRFGHGRVRDTPISETAILGAAIGAAVRGLRPVAEIMIMDFLPLCLDQLVNHAAKLHYMSAGRLSVPLTVRTAVAAKSGSGATHSQSLESWLMHTPGLKVAVPSTPFDAKGMLTTCIFDDDPCVFIENVVSYGKKGPIGVDRYAIPCGSADVKRVGTDLTIIAYGWMTDEALSAADRLEQAGVSAEVVDLRWLLPLDEQTILTSVEKTRRAVVAHSATRFTGPGAEIAALITEELFADLAAPVERVGAPFVPVPYGPHLEQGYYPGADSIVAAALKALTASSRTE